jgi:CRP-like cAMP-binding protein
LSLAERPIEGTAVAGPDSSNRIGNLLFDAFPPDTRARFVDGAVMKPIEPGRDYVSIGDEVRWSFFPMSGTMSILAQPDEETTVEASTVGREGAADAFASIGSLRARHRLIGQIAGQVLVMDAKLLTEEVSHPGRTQTLVFSYIQALYCQAAISAACNAQHPVTQRAARWLLASHDRVDVDSFTLKHEFLAYMLGVSRPTVSIAAGALKTAGVLDYSRGTVTILDREGLEAAACACYEQVRLQYSELIEL